MQRTIRFKHKAESDIIQFRKFIELSIQYGLIIRTIPFGKKMVIIYSVEDEHVYIQRIMPQSMIIY